MRNSSSTRHRFPPDIICHAVWLYARFTLSYRDEVLDAHLFSTLDQVREISEKWKNLYNEYRPHDALGRIPPAKYMRNLKLENSSLELWT